MTHKQHVIENIKTHISHLNIIHVTVFIITFILTLWIAASYFNITFNNLGSCDYAKWNLFTLIFK